MRRPLTFAAFFLIIAIVPVCAQRGGGAHGGSGGGHASSGGGHAMSGGHSFGGGFGGGSHASSYSGSHASAYAGPRSSSRYISQARSGPGSRSFSYGRPSHYVRRPGTGGGRRGGHEGHSGGTRWRIRTRGDGWGYGYPYYGYYDPYLYPGWRDSGFYGDDDQAGDQQIGNDVEEENPGAEQDQDAYAQDPPDDPPGRPAASHQSRQEPATVLVFRDGHEKKIENYAIVASTLWNVAGTRTEKIPLDSLDIPATIRLNEQRGVDFQLPHTSEGEGQ